MWIAAWLAAATLAGDVSANGAPAETRDPLTLATIQSLEGLAELPPPLLKTVQDLLQEECPGALQSQAAVPWLRAEALHFLAQDAFYSAGAEGSAMLVSFSFILEMLRSFLFTPPTALVCPLLAAQRLQYAAHLAVMLSRPRQALAFLQLGGAFKLEAMWQWLEQSRADPNYAKAHPRFHSRLHIEYTISVDSLYAAWAVPIVPLKKWLRPSRPTVEIHSLCFYPQQQQQRHSKQQQQALQLPDLSVPNHRAYAQRHGHKYVLHQDLPRPDLGPQFSKPTVVLNALRVPSPPDWVFYIDCDAFFTNFDTAIEDILETYGASSAGDAAGADSPHLLVAEDPGGINTGVLVVRSSPWSARFLARVEENRFPVAWDQSMFFWEILMPGLLQADAAAGGVDFQLPPEVALVHQAHLNAFVPPASRDWHAYEWRPGDFVKHFAGCPYQERDCAEMMAHTATAVREYWPEAFPH